MSSRPLIVSLFLLIIISAVPARARAHSIGVSQGEYQVGPERVRATLTLARPEVVAAVAGLDADGDGTLTRGELKAGERALEEALVRGLKVTTSSRACEGALDEAHLAEEDGLTIVATFRCEAPSAFVAFDVAFLRDLSSGHRHLATAAAGGQITYAVVYASNTRFRVPRPAPGAEIASTRGGIEAGGDTASPFMLALEQLLARPDPLVCMLGLILIGGALEALAATLAAFILAELLTLGLAGAGVLALSPSLVEPAIALSIAYVGLENFFVRDARRRWLIALPFGALHGAGLARALDGASGGPITAFAAGLAVAEISVFAALVPAILWLERRAWFRARGVKAVSGLISGAGIAWFVLRVRG